MIQQESILKVVDNSGAKKVKCIKVLGGFKKRYAGLGDIIVVSVQRLRKKSKKTSKVLKGGVFRALVVQTKSVYQKKDGLSFLLKENSVVLINKQGNQKANEGNDGWMKFLKVAVQRSCLCLIISIS